jgi:aminomethyltransferase
MPDSPDAVRRTPLHAEHVALGGRLVPFAGWELPVQYVGVVAEHKAVREAAGLFDVCHMGELELRGEHAVALANHLTTNDFGTLPVGKAQYTLCCNPGGTILDDLILYKRGPDHVVIVCNASNRAKIAAHFAAAAPGHCDFRDVSDETGLLALQGPRAAEILRAAGAREATTALASFAFADDAIAGVPVTAARTGYTGEDGFELFTPASGAATVWRALLEAGRPFGLVPAGLGARDTLRLEARLSLYGNEIDETTNPIEAGLGWVVKLDKGEFVGREAIARVKSEGPARKLVGFEMVGRGIARHGYPILDARSGERVGVVTSGSPGPTVGKNIGLGYVPAALAAEGTELAIEIRGQAVAAKVVRTPFYKRAK